MDESSTDVNTAVETQETTTTESSPVETKAPEVADPIMDGLKEDEPKVDPKKETEGEPAPKPEEEAKPTEETETEEQPQGKKDANTRIRQLANENRQLKQTIEQLNAQVYKPQTVQELMEEGETEAMAEAKALRQEIEVERFNRQVTELNNSLESDSQRALQDFPIFDPESKEYVPEIAERAQQLYLSTAGLQEDPNTGLIISANVLPYDFYKTIYETVQTSSTEGKLKGQRAAEQMLANVETPSSGSPKEAKEDPIMKGLLSD